MTGREHVNWVRDEIKRNAASDPDFVQAYVEDALRRRIAHQIRALREAKGWNQKDLGERMNKPQGNISRMEDPEYGKWSLRNTFRIRAHSRRRSVFRVHLVRGLHCSHRGSFVCAAS